MALSRAWSAVAHVRALGMRRQVGARLSVRLRHAMITAGTGKKRKGKQIMIETTDLELSKKLEPILKGKVGSYFAWCDGKARNKESAEACEKIMPDSLKGWAIIPAYTACELMKVLPDSIDYEGERGRIFIYKHEDEWFAAYHGEYDINIICFMDTSFTQATGEMIVWLDGQGLLK
jgi:hypothetical protein